MNNVLLSIKTDEQTKRELKSFASELGVTSTALVNMVVKQALRDRRIVLSTDLEPTDYLEQIMRRANADHTNNLDITHTKGTQGALDHIDSLLKK
jgi:antitoxin component of RelBE/YafQ-DinJ toxin-antitoxin module